MKIPDIVIVTPTTGSPKLEKAVQSVQNQDGLDDLSWEHWIVVDGSVEEANRYENTTKVVERYQKNTRLLTIPYVTGRDHTGHRIYAMCHSISPSKYICHLDEDNFYKPNHVRSLYDLCEKHSLHFAFSLRSIHDEETCEEICDDNCESLGMWPSFLNKNDFHIDTNCYFMQTSLAGQMTGTWYRKARPHAMLEADRAACKRLRETQGIRYGTTGLHSLGYRVGNRPDSVSKDFFLHGNSVMSERFATFPWNQEIINIEKGIPINE